jgi:hypothetical protein
MHQQHLEAAECEVAGHLLHGAPGEPDVADLTLVPQCHQRLDRPTRAGQVLERVVLRVVQEDQWQVIQAEPMLGLGHTSPDACAGVVTATGVHLGADEEVPREASVAGDCRTDPPFAFAAAVTVCGVEYADG